MGWIDKAYNRVWKVTKGNRGSNEHVAVRTGMVFLPGQGEGEVIMGLVNNGAPKAFQVAYLTWNETESKLYGTVTAGAEGTTYSLEVARDSDCSDEMIREGLCSRRDRPVIKCEFTGTPSVGAGGGSGGGTWHAED